MDPRPVTLTLPATGLGTRKALAASGLGADTKRLQTDLLLGWRLRAELLRDLRLKAA